MSPTPSGELPTFMVHKHDATRLHYDLRLEVDGALASWAIPKGPSYDPSEKRLAVQTEDHPLEYGNFEGRIPDTEYGGGDSLIWDRGHFDTVPPKLAAAQRKKGHLHLRLQGQKLQGDWHLVRTRPGPGGKAQWLLFKAKDGREDENFDVVAERPESVQSGRVVTRGPVRKKDLRAPHPDPRKLLDKVWPPMLATLATATAVDPEQFVFEVKYDGYRGLAAISSGKVSLLTRNGLDLSGRFPEVYRGLSRILVAEAVLDGEVIALDPKGVPRFGLLMEPGVDHRFVAFDLLWLDGEDLRSRPLQERRDLLQSVLSNVPPPIVLAEQVEGPLQELLRETKRRGLEGLIAKRRGSAYEGRRSKDWLKVKVQATQEVVVVGFTPIKSGAKELGALLVGVNGDDGLHFAGKVGTGFSARLRRELYARLQKDRTESAPVLDAPRMRAAIWVRPRLVAQVQFTEWTRDGKLRHPSFQGLREGKEVGEVRRELPSVPDAQGERRAPSRKAARMGRAPAPAVEVEVKLTSGTRLVYPKPRLTKADVFEYYRDMAEVMVPALEGRPLALKQWPKGLSDKSFYRQHVADLPQWATRATVKTARRAVSHPVVDHPQTLLWLANRSALELHMWHSRVPHLSEPDWVVFDLDPGKGPFEDLVTVAQALHGLLDKLGLCSVPKTSGRRGLHVLVPICRGHNYADTLDFAVAITRALEHALGDIATTERSVGKRGGRLYLDALQNAEGKTIIAPYSLRGVEDATVSTPLRWSEVTWRLDPSRFTLKTLRSRLDKLGDLFAPALHGQQRLPRFASWR
jgi:bifunctional non-homologous end joining protein LigD